VRELLIAVILLSTIASVGCGGPVDPPEPARAVAPPAGWEEELAQWRRDKDDMFRNSPNSPLHDSFKAAFAGLDYYPVDPSLRYEGKLAIDPRPARQIIVGTEGERRPAERWARFAFERDGRVHTLQVFRLMGVDRGSVFFAFSDETTGRETYPAGRYVDPEIGEDGSVVVDFNRAYFPFCAYGKEYDCPITPAENRLDIPILAGEKGWVSGATATRGVQSVQPGS
jgi:uncharacterized protein (DUF1684 family)